MDEDQLNHPNAFVYGCDPDYDVWKVKWNPKPKADDPKLRSGGGHIHVCYTNPNSADSIRIGRALDYWVGAPLAEIDPDKRRRLLYGKPGAIRFKPYGLEYRTPSNFWTMDQQRVEAVYYNVAMALNYIKTIDDWRKSFESARYFLEGKESEWDKDTFLSRAMPYEGSLKNIRHKVNIDPSTLELMKGVALSLKMTPPHPEDAWEFEEMPKILVEPESEEGVLS
jgi:hypothetical protein